MEARHFYKSVGPLVTRTFACKWSEDDRLSVVTEKGVQIYEVIPAPMQATPAVNLCRTFIHPPDDMPSELFAEQVLNSIWDWKKEDVYSFLMNDAFTPNFPKATKFTPEIIDVFWSPWKLLHPCKCMIAMLTSAGAVELAIQVDYSWISIYKFTSTWCNVVKEELKSVHGEDAKLECDALKDQLQRLLATSVTWSCLYNKDSDAFAYLVIGYRNSEIVIWKVDRVASASVTLNTEASVELKFKKKLGSENVKISTLLWVDLSNGNYLLIIGFYNGLVGALKLQEFEGGITSSSYSLSYSDEDNIPVDSLYVVQQSQNQIELAVVKGMYLLILVLDNRGKMIDMKFGTSPGFSITGISYIDSNLLLTTQDGSICIVDKSSNKEELDFLVIKNDVMKTNVQYLGLGSSANKILFALITSPSVMYDHLINREPSCVYFCTFHNVPPLDPLNILYFNEEKSLLRHWDCLNLIKVNALKYNNLQQMLPRVSVDLESLSLYKLRIAFWILNINENTKKRNPKEILRAPEEIQQYKFYIFLLTALDYLSYLSKKESLNEIQKLSMRLLTNHLEVWLAGEDDEEEAETPLLKYVKQVLQATSKFDLTEQEKCSLCGQIITEPWASTCPIGHKLPRCAITCLQVTQMRFRTCLICQEIFHPCLDAEMSEVKCLYCDLPAVHKYQLPDSEVQASKKNLSRRPVIVTIKDSKEEEE